MKIHEYQAKDLLKEYGIPIPRGGVAFSPAEAEKIAQDLGGDTMVVKAQIHAGGRGKGGGVKLAHSHSEVRDLSSQILGMRLVTHQTGPEGRIVKRVLIEEGVEEIDQELYIGMVLDRSKSCLVAMASQAGGMDIEQVASETPEKILKEIVDPAVGLQAFQAMRLSFGLGLSGGLVRKGAQLIQALYQAFIKSDFSLVEINPLVRTRGGEILALDAKINLDDNAMNRHPKLSELRDLDEEEPLEVEASKFGLNYIKLDGSVGCMVNGAGLAMATMDIIKLAGESPANFLDVGGGANVESVENGFRILMSDPNVKAVLINIFGGIVRCDRVAEGVVQALRNMHVMVPVVVRLEGTNADEGTRILEESGLDFSVARALKEAAEKVVAVTK